MNAFLALPSSVDVYVPTGSVMQDPDPIATAVYCE
jgi:hypothetical protein